MDYGIYANGMLVESTCKTHTQYIKNKNKLL